MRVRWVHLRIPKSVGPIIPKQLLTFSMKYKCQGPCSAFFCLHSSQLCTVSTILHMRPLATVRLNNLSKVLELVPGKTESWTWLAHSLRQAPGISRELTSQVPFGRCPPCGVGCPFLCFGSAGFVSLDKLEAPQWQGPAFASLAAFRVTTALGTEAPTGVFT